MFENMTNTEKSKELEYRFAQICGGKNQFRWDLNDYVHIITIEKHMIRVQFMYKFYLSFDVMKRLQEEFPTCNLRVESESDRLVLVIEY